MNKYDFKSLNDKDLEELVADLLSRDSGSHFQKFKSGKDRGVDLLLSSEENDYEIVVQVKHFLSSGYSVLRSAIRKEKEKIELISPNRYIFATSVPLSNSNKLQIKEILSPYIKSLNDILGQEDLNDLIMKYPDIEIRHNKLWMSSTIILEKIYNSTVSGRSEFEEVKIKRDIRLYVETSDYNKALEIINKKRILLITGVPGIGKTSLAKMISYYLMSKEYHMVHISKIEDAESFFKNDHTTKQLFYFDDFLGSNYLNIVNNIGGSSIVSFLGRINHYKNKYFILTTRTTILNQAKLKDEKFSDSSLVKGIYQLELRHYSFLDKAKILYKHMSFSDIRKDFINIIFQNSNFKRIIYHKNFNPRLIEFFTKECNLSYVNNSSEYFEFIMHTLENPKKIWEYAIKNQLSQTEKLFLYTLMSMGQHSVKKLFLKNAFERRYNYEIKNNGYTRDFCEFDDVSSTLLDGFIINIINVSSNDNRINFINPSLRDFLIQDFNYHKDEKWRIINSAFYIEQIIMIFSIANKNNHKINIFRNEIRTFISIVDSLTLSSFEEFNQSIISIKICIFFSENFFYTEKQLVENSILKRLHKINLDDLSADNQNLLLILIENCLASNSLISFFKKKIDIIVEVILKTCNSIDTLKRLIKVLKIFQINLENYRLDDDMWIEIVHNAVNDIYENEADLMWNDRINEIIDEQDADDIENDIFNLYENVVNLIMPKNDFTIDYSPKYYADLDSIISENNYNDEEFDQHISVDKNRTDITEEEEIDAIFSQSFPCD